MLCDLAIRGVSRPNGETIHILRVTGRTALGPSGTGGKAMREFGSEQEMLDLLAALDLPHEVVSVARGIVQDPGYRDHFITVSSEVQIPFDALERCDLDLFDE
jgi:hypothetical protein